MAILTEGAGSSQMNSATTPMRAVQEVNPLDSLAGLAQGGLSVLNTKNQADAAQAKAQAVADKDAKKFAGEQEDTALSQDLLKISERFAQKGNREDAIRLSRAALVKAMNSPGNDGRGDELISSYTKFMAVQGLGKDFFEESAAEKAQAIQMDLAAKAGVQFLDTDSPERVQVKLDNFTAYQREGEKLQRVASELAVVNAKLTEKGKLTTNEASLISLQKTKLEQKQSEALTGLADGFSTIFNDSMMNARTAFDISGDRQASLDAVEQGYMQIRNLVNATGGTGNATQVTALTTPMTNMYDATKRYIQGKDTLDMLETTRKTEDARMVAMMFAKNPDIQARIAASNLIGNTDVGLTQVIGSKVIEYMDANLSNKPTVLTDAEPEEQKAIVGLGLKFIEKDTAGKTTEAEKAEGMAYITKIFTDFDKYAASVDSPQQLNELVAMMADPRFGAWAKANEGIPASISVQVKETLKAYYSEPVLKDVVQNWEKDVAIDQRTFGFSGIGGLLDAPVDPANAVRALPEILEPFMTASGLSFRARQGAPQNLVAPALKQVNTSVLPKINRLIKAMAHAEGTTDYNKVFEENYAQILGVAPEEAQAETKTKAPMSSEEFTPLEGDTIESGAVVGGYKFNGGDTSDPANWSKVNG